jgi:hypothetical protein
MKQALIDWLKTNGAKHAEAIAIAAVLVFCGRMWLLEHDARLSADTKVKAAETTINTLEKQQSVTAQAAKVTVTVLQKEADAVKTPEEATAALQAPAKDVAEKVTPLAVEAVPDAPSRVSVLSAPLYTEVNSCQQCSVKLDAAQKELDIQKQITGEKDVQIAALKKKPGFMTRVVKGLKVVACAGAGGAVGSLTKTAEGAAIGAAAGAGACQMF